jgi:hypothetical protein
MSAQYLALGEGVAPTPNGGAGRDGKRAFDESQGRLSTHIRREGRGKLSAKGASPVELQREAIAEGGKGPSPRLSPLSAKTQNPVDWTTPMPKRADTVSTSRLPLHMMRIAIANRGEEHKVAKPNERRLQQREKGGGFSKSINGWLQVDLDYDSTDVMKKVLGY